VHQVRDQPRLDNYLLFRNGYMFRPCTNIMGPPTEHFTMRQNAVRLHYHVVSLFVTPQVYSIY